jgi:hypothetical protein
VRCSRRIDVCCSLRSHTPAASCGRLKLQGALGKFGKVDLTDIDAFAIFPDGKVLSGTVSGARLPPRILYCECVDVSVCTCFCELVRVNVRPERATV